MLHREELLAGRSLVRGTYSTVEDCRYEFIFLFRGIPGPSAGSALYFAIRSVLYFAICDSEANKKI